jgi:hypothetical protein
MPLAPRLEFAEPVAPGTLVVLVSDAHSGAPVHSAVVDLLPQFSRRAMSDSLGRARLTDLPPGRHTVQVRRIGYHTRADTVSMREGHGVAMLVQLRRAALRLENVTVGSR